VSQRLFLREIQAIHGSLSLVRDLLIPLVKVVRIELLENGDEA
jgi:hypothetical protein